MKEVVNKLRDLIEVDVPPIWMKTGSLFRWHIGIGNNQYVYTVGETVDRGTDEVARLAFLSLYGYEPNSRKDKIRKMLCYRRIVEELKRELYD